MGQNLFTSGGQLPSPALAVDLDQVDRNIQKLVSENKRHGIRVRPHIKTHKSVWLAKRQLALGCQGITCAKLGEAEVMAEAGIDDLLLAFPLIGSEKWERLKKLAQTKHVLTIVNSMAGARGLSAVGQALGRPIRVLLDLDGGLKRGGLQPLEATRSFARSIRSLPGLEIMGLMYYAGNIYQEKKLAGFDRMTRLERDMCLQTADLLQADGFKMEVLSGGNSFSGKRPHLMTGMTEVRSGNFIFNDCNQLSTGMATVADCCLRVIATVVSRVDDKRVIIDAGSKTLTSDACGNRPGFGYVVDHPDILIEKLNEEHGFLVSSQAINLSIGDRIEIIPNHACGLPNLVDHLYGFRSGVFQGLIAVEARGKNH